MQTVLISNSSDTLDTGDFCTNLLCEQGYNLEESECPRYFPFPPLSPLLCPYNWATIFPPNILLPKKLFGDYNRLFQTEHKYNSRMTVSCRNLEKYGIIF